MVDITYQMVLSTLQTIALIVGIVYYITIMRNQNRSRQIQIMGSTTIMDLTYDFANWDTDDYDVFMSEHGSEADPEGWKALYVWFNSLALQGV